MISNLLEHILGTRLWALILKETREILRNKHLVFLLLVTPIVQLVILAAALDPQVRSLSLGIVDHAGTSDSRELIASMRATGIFPDAGILATDAELSRQLHKGKLDVGVVIPPDFTRDLNKNRSADVQILLDGTNAYTAGIAKSYVLRTIEQLDTRASMQKRSLPIDPQATVLFNRGLVSSWYFVPGVLGAALTLTATLVSSASVLRERESGTLEQLLMTPATNVEIMAAKIIPLVGLLLCDVALALLSSKVFFDLPFRGDPLLFFLASLFYICAGIGLGMLLGTLCKQQRQAQLASFFMNIPLILLSGSVVPSDTLPAALQAVALLDPLRYYSIIARNVLMKGSGFATMWQELVILAAMAVIILTFSVSRFRRHLV